MGALLWNDPALSTSNPNPKRKETLKISKMSPADKKISTHLKKKAHDEGATLIHQNRLCCWEFSQLFILEHLWRFLTIKSSSSASVFRPTHFFASGVMRNSNHLSFFCRAFPSGMTWTSLKKYCTFFCIAGTVHEIHLFSDKHEISSSGLRVCFSISGAIQCLGTSWRNSQTLLKFSSSSAIKIS